MNMDDQIIHLVSQLNETFGPPFLPVEFFQLTANKQDDGSWMFNLYIGRRDIQLLLRNGEFKWIGQATEMRGPRAGKVTWGTPEHSTGNRIGVQ